MLCVQQGERGSTGSKGFAGAPGDKVKQHNILLLQFKLEIYIWNYSVMNHARNKFIYCGWFSACLFIA